MIFTKIWERYFLKEFSKCFFLFLTLFYGFYILIDYANHTSSMHHHHIHFSWKEFAFYYGCEFLKRLDLLLPFAILIATIRTLCNLNVHNELVALIASGIPLKRVLRPFLLAGLLGVCLVYFNIEVLLPRALRKLQYFEDSQKKLKNKNLEIPSASSLSLEDGTLLLFLNYDSVERRFFDVYWIKTFDDIYKIKFLDPHTKNPTGYFVDHLVRNLDGQLILQASSPTFVFPEMKFNKEKLIETIIPLENLSISKLWKKKNKNINSTHEKEAKIHTVLLHKQLIPWLCLLAIFGPAPFCLFFTRQLPVFFIYAGGIFGLLAIYLLLDAAKILGERQVLNAEVALGIPFLFFAGFFTYKFQKIH